MLCERDVISAGKGWWLPARNQRDAIVCPCRKWRSRVLYRQKRKRTNEENEHTWWVSVEAATQKYSAQTPHMNAATSSLQVTVNIHVASLKKQQDSQIGLGSDITERWSKSPPSGPSLTLTLRRRKHHTLPRRTVTRKDAQVREWVMPQHVKG